jgi:short-subunit dehydrogenase
VRIDTARVLITGGAGGLGRAFAAALLARGAHVLLVDRDAAALRTAKLQFGPMADRVDTFTADLVSAADRTRLIHAAEDWHGGVDTLINNAGLNPFGLFEEQSADQIDAALAVNVHAPLQLCRQLLPHLLSRPRAFIVNVGSVFGAIGYPGYAIYCTTKFALRGFTEALRRELAKSNVRVAYLAPRATRTPINSSNVERMNAELGVTMDSPQQVADRLVHLLRSGHSSAVVGWPEKLFVRVNAVFPALVDRAIDKQLPIIERYAQAVTPPATLKRKTP